ncbi:MAG: hypothetical protein AAF349_24825 [Cyanobacteria bacterium P01_A01_bin.68]
MANAWENFLLRTILDVWMWKEDIGADGYYIQEAVYRLEAAKRTLQDDGEET